MKRLILSVVFLGISTFCMATDLSIRTTIQKKRYGKLSASFNKIEDTKYNELTLKTDYYKNLVSVEYFINNDYSKQWLYVNLLDITEGLRVRLSYQLSDWKDSKLMLGIGYKVEFRSFYIDSSYDSNMAGVFTIKSKFGVTLIPDKRISISPAWIYSAYNDNDNDKSQIYLEIKIKL